MSRPYAGTPLRPDLSQRLYVRRDFMNPREWRLAWSTPDSGSFVYDTGECDPAGRFRTRAAARAYGLRHYQERAASWPRHWI